MSGLFGDVEAKPLGTTTGIEGNDAVTVDAFVKHMAALGTPIDPETAKTLIGLKQTTYQGRTMAYTNAQGQQYQADVNANGQIGASGSISRLVDDFQKYYKNKNYLDYVDTAKAKPGRSATILTPYSGPDAKTLLGASNSKTVLGG